MDHGTRSIVANVIVVDDEPELLEVLCDVLREDGHHVRGALNAQEALILYWDQAADVIVADIVMPSFPVDHLFQGLKDLEAAPHILILTGADENLLENYLHYPILRKPFEYLDLCQRIRETLGLPISLELHVQNRQRLSK